jgi:GTP-binding protein
MAQLKARPPTFVLFASRAESLPDQYRRYLINSLRESFDLPGVPIRITIKSGKNPFVEGGAEQSDGRARPATKRFGGGKADAKQPSWKPQAPKRAGPRRGGKPVGGKPVGGKGR